MSADDLVGATRAGDDAEPAGDIPESVRRLVCSVTTMALVSLTGFLLVLWVFTRTARGQMWDERARLSTGSSARAWAHIVDPLTYITIASTGAFLLAFVAIALVRRRFALAAAAVLPGRELFEGGLGLLGRDLVGQGSPPALGGGVVVLLDHALAVA